MFARATRSAPSPRTSGVRLALLLVGGIALAASAQSYRIPDLKPPSPRVAPAPRAGEPCDACGRILSIREISISRGIPAAALAVPGGEPGNAAQQNPIGAVIYLPLGRQGAEKPYVGGVGTPEAYARMRETTYEITLRMDDGTHRFVRRADGGSSFGVGDRVQWLGGDELALLVNT
jgi:hypothetical protein